MPNQQASRIGILTSPLGGDTLALERLVAVEAISDAFAITLDVVAGDGPVELAAELGAAFHVDVQGGPGAERSFHGRLWEFSELERDAEGAHYRLVLRPFFAFMGLNCTSRIYQGKSVKDILSDVFKRREVSAHVDMGGLGTYDTYEYCVQYQESDHDFLSRLMEHEGIYYWFEHSSSGHKMVLADGSAGPASAPGLDRADFIPRSQTPDGRCIWSAAFRHAVAPIQTMGRDYDFTTPAATLGETARGADPSPADTDELYIHPVGYDSKSTRAQYVKRRIEAARTPRARLFAHGDVFAAATGRTLHLARHPNDSRNIDYFVVAATHRLTAQAYRSGKAGADDDLDVDLELMPRTDPYRPPMRTRKPRIAGPQTAKVVGSAGEEIETDEYGRIKVQFPWDREGQDDQHSSCWMRVAQSVAGGGWGAFTLPRIGQEVIVEFLEGDPDRPIVTGGVYNAANKTPYALPAEKTKQTFKTNSSKGGGGFNELRFEDKAGSEEVFFHAEKDLNSVIDKGDETRKLNLGSRTTTIEQGDETLDINTGKRTEKIMGNDSLTLTQGNHSIKIDTGSSTVEAMQSITLKVGQNSIKIDQTGVTIKALMIKVDADTTMDLKAGVKMTVSGGVNTAISGAIVMIN